MKQLNNIITEQLDEMLNKKRFGAKWSLTKRHLIELVKIRFGTEATCREIAQAVKELSPSYPFLMKTPAGYCFPANKKEWSDYTLAREKQARGLLHDAIEDSNRNYNDFKTQH